MLVYMCVCVCVYVCVCVCVCVCVQVTWYINMTCLLIFVFEAMVKIIYNVRRYFGNYSDTFDFLITVISIVEVFVLARFGLELGLGSLRQFRLVRIGDMSPTFVNMKETIISAFPEAAAVVILLFVAIFIFGCIMQTLFPTIKFGMVFGPTSNAADLVQAMLLLFKMSSGAGGRDPSTSWGHYVTDASVSIPYCTDQAWLPTPKSVLVLEQDDEAFYRSPMGPSGRDGDDSAKKDCGNPLAATLFFFLFEFLCMFIIMPTLIASTINSYFNANMRKLSLITAHDIDTFMEVWKDIMDKNTGRPQELDAVRAGD